MAKFTALLLVVYLACFIIMIEAKPLEKALAVKKSFAFTTAAIEAAMRAITGMGTAAMLPLSDTAAALLTATTATRYEGTAAMLPVALLAMGVAPA